MAVERRILWRIAVLFAVISAVSATSHIMGPHFTRQPQNTTVNIDSTVEKVELECDTDGTAPIQYYWTKDGDNITLTERIYLTNGRLTINNPDMTDKGWYQCYAFNQIGVVMSKNAYLAFAYVSDFTRESPPDVTFTEYEGGCLDCLIPDHYPGVNVQWFKNGRPLTIDFTRQSLTLDGRLCFSIFRRNDEGQYHCSAANVIQSGAAGSQKLSGQFYIEVQSSSIPNHSKPPTVGVEVENREALLGETVKLECFFYGNTPPTYRWSRKDGDLPLNHHQNNNNQQLNIPNVNLDDAGDYECIASNDVEQNKKISGHVSVRVPPQWVTELEDIKADIYSEATFECEATSPDGVEYKWYRNTEPLDTRDRHTFSNEQKTLKIIDLAVEDTAMYQCVAENKYGSAYSTGQLTVRAIKPTFDPPGVPLIVNQPAPRKGTVVIKCEPDAAPKPIFEWFHNDNEITTGGRYTILDGGNLQIENINDEDGGNYKCAVTNAMGSSESTGSLVIKDGTNIKEFPESDTITMGTDYTLRCSATTDEIFELVYIWMKGDTQIDVEDDDHYEMDGGNLKILDVQLRHAGTYKCVAQTVVDMAETDAEILVMGPPDPPIGVAAELNTDNQKIDVVISWSPGSDNHSPITGYSIQSRTNHMSEWKEERNLIPASAIESNVNDLSPWSRYEFRVLAENELGTGEPSEPSEPIETPTRRPKKSPENVRGCCGGIGNLKIEWDPLPTQDWNGPNLRYIVKWTANEDNTDDPDNSYTTSVNVTHHLVEGVTAYTKYFVRVIAENDDGEGAASPVAEVFSFEELPSEAPSDVQGRGTSGSSIRVSWSGIGPDSFNGVLSGYKIKYWQSSETIETAEVLKSPGTSSSAANIMGLEPNTNYQFVVVAYNGDNENGPDSTEASTKTLKNAPLNAPSNLRVMGKSKNSVDVKWNAVKIGPSEETLTGYKVLYWKDGQFEKDAEVEIVTAPDTMTTINGLDKIDNYLFKVRGYSSGGDGPVQDTPTKIDPSYAEQSTGGKGGASRSLDSSSVTFLFLSLLSLLLQWL